MQKQRLVGHHLLDTLQQHCRGVATIEAAEASASAKFTTWTKVVKADLFDLVPPSLELDCRSCQATRVRSYSFCFCDRTLHKVMVRVLRRTRDLISGRGFRYVKFSARFARVMFYCLPISKILATPLHCQHLEPEHC